MSSADFRKQSQPRIRDDDPDLSKYNMMFDNYVACYEVGRKKISDLTRFAWYAGGFVEGSTRKKVYDNAHRKAVHSGRMPQDAGKLLEEIKNELLTYIWETKMQKMMRLDREFDRLEQASMSHANFRVAWEAKLQDMEEAEMDMPTEHTLYRRYLQKINPEYRVKVLSREWKLDGEDKPARMPKTYQEVSTAISMLLEERADIQAVGTNAYDSLNSLDSGPTGGKSGSRGGKPGGKGDLVCSHCHAVNNHNSTICPQRAADSRGESDACQTRNTARNKGCDQCGAFRHDQRHHMMAVQDYSSRRTGSIPQGGGNGGGGNGGKGRGDPSRTGGGGNPNDNRTKTPGGSDNVRKEQCKWGASCFDFIKKGSCPKYHSKAELRC
jgi:hypothetical protein